MSHYDVFSRQRAWALLRLIVAPDKRFFMTLLSYSVVISLLSLALPISVQALINTVANTVMLTPLVTLSLVLLALLGFSSLIRGLKVLVSEFFQRHFFVRLTSEITLRSLYVPYHAFESINRNELMNKFFEIVTIQKSLPYLITGVFFITLQTVAGVILSSLYHPVYFIFNIILLGSLYAVWHSHHVQAVTHSVAESTEKHRLAAWLQEVGRSHHLLKSQSAKAFAVKRSNEIVDAYLLQRESHFKHLFRQISYLLILYVLANTVLLFISGLLVIRGELTLGQLVATEIIFSGIFVNFYRAGDYLASYYDILASCEKLKSFFDLDLEKESGYELNMEMIRLEFQDAEYEKDGEVIPLSLVIEPGKTIAIGTKSSSYKALLRDSILGFKYPSTGALLINDHPIDEVNIHHYRNYVSLIDSQGVLEGSIREYLSFGCSAINDAKMYSILKKVGLTDKFKQQGLTLDSDLHPSGYPLSRTDTFRLKLARSIAEKPKLVIINDYLNEIIFDDELCTLFRASYDEDTTVILMDNYIRATNVDDVHYLDSSGFVSCQTVKEMQDHVQAR